MYWIDNKYNWNVQNLQQRPKGRKKVSQGQIKINHCSLSTDFLARTRAEKNLTSLHTLHNWCLFKTFFSSKNGKDFNPMAFIGLYWPLKSSLFLAALKIHKLPKILLILIKTWIKSHRKNDLITPLWWINCLNFGLYWTGLCILSDPIEILANLTWFGIS